MKAPSIKRLGRAPSKNVAATASKLVKPISEQIVVERLRQVRTEIDRLPLPVGDLGCQFLDALELVDQIRTRVREKAKELLLKELGLIPGRKAVEGGPCATLPRHASDLRSLKRRKRPHASKLQGSFGAARRTKRGSPGGSDPHLFGSVKIRLVAKNRSVSKNTTSQREKTAPYYIPGLWDWHFFWLCVSGRQANFRPSRADR